MVLRRFHYDVAFEHYLRERSIPYVAVHEARRALMLNPDREKQAQSTLKLKRFDFVVYSQTGLNLLVDVKGRKHSGRSNKSLDNWVTQDDVDCMLRWEELFGNGFCGAFAFLYWCDVQPPDALFHDTFMHGDRWYAVLGIKLGDYRSHVRTRSPRWGTVSIPAKQFTQLAVPFKDML